MRGRVGIDLGELIDGVGIGRVRKLCFFLVLLDMDVTLHVLVK